MFIELERLKDPESCRNYLKNELQKARQPKRVHYFITAADWMFYENDREQKFTYVWPRLWLNDDSTAASKIGTILGKCQTAFQKGYFEELFNHPELFIRKDCPRRPSNLHQRYCKRAFPWEFERSKKRIGCPWLQLPDDGRPFQEAWKEAGRRWFRYKFIEKAKNGRN